MVSIYGGGGEVCSNGHGGGERDATLVLGLFQILVPYGQFHYAVLYGT
jgi:hypothetical protein